MLSETVPAWLFLLLGLIACGLSILHWWSVDKIRALEFELETANQIIDELKKSEA